MPVEDLLKQLEKCKQGHEAKVNECKTADREAKDALKQAEAAKSHAESELKRAQEDYVSEGLKYAQEFIDKEIMVDLNLPRYDRDDVTKLMIELRQMRHSCSTIEERVEIAKRFWRLKSYFVKFPLLSRIKAALEKKKPDWKIEFRPNGSNKENHWLYSNQYQIEKNTLDYRELDGEWLGKFGDYEFGSLYLGDIFLCGVNCNPTGPHNWHGTYRTDDYSYYWFEFNHPSLLNDITAQYWIYGSGVKPLSFSNFTICDRLMRGGYNDVHCVNELRAAAINITPEFLIAHANEKGNATEKTKPADTKFQIKRTYRKQPYTPKDFSNMCKIVSSICETGWFGGCFKGACNMWLVNDHMDDDREYEPDPRTTRPLDENEIADAIIACLRTVEEEEARQKAAQAEKKRLAKLPKNSEEAIGIKFPWATKVEKLVDGIDSYSYFKVYCGGKCLVLCMDGSGRAQWKKESERHFKYMIDSELKFYFKMGGK